jgi:hypothetical protein
LKEKESPLLGCSIDLYVHHTLPQAKHYFLFWLVTNCKFLLSTISKLSLCYLFIHYDDLS